MPSFTKKFGDLHYEGPTIEVRIYPPASVINDLSAKGQQLPSKKLIALIDTGA